MRCDKVTPTFREFSFQNYQLDEQNAAEFYFFFFSSLNLFGEIMKEFILILLLQGYFHNNEKQKYLCIKQRLPTL